MPDAVLILHLVVLVMGFSVLIRPDLHAKRSGRRHAKRLAQLRRGAGEAYLEERRELETYRPLANLAILRFFGGVMVVGACVAIASAWA